MQKIGQVMTRLTVCLHSQSTIGDAFKIIREKKLPGIPLVNEEGSIEGIITLEQVLEKNLEEFSYNQKAYHYLNTNFMTLTEDTKIDQVWDLSFDLFLVLNREKAVCGIVTKNDLARAFFEYNQLRVQELEAVFNSAYSSIVAINKQGVITSMNSAAEGPTRTTREQAIGRYLNDVIIPEGLLEVVRTGIPQFGVKFQVGKRKYITDRTPIVKNGEVVGAVGVFQDISQLEYISQELESVKNLNDELRIIVDSTGDGIIVCNSQSEIIRCNSTVEKILGISRGNFMGQSFTTLVEQGILTKNMVYLVKSEGGVKSVLEKSKSGKSIIVTGTPVYDEEGEMKKIVVNIRDISESLELRKALEQNKMLSEQYQTEIAQIRKSVSSSKQLIVQSAAMKKVLHIVQRVSSVQSPVAFIGEDGVGKHELAKLTHEHSPQREKHFITLNCKTIPEHILESELFGDNNGLSVDDRKGLLGSTEVGTIFFEEISSMSYSLQLKISQYLRSREQSNSQKGNKPRFIIGCAKPLREYVDNGVMNEELFFSLNVIPIKIPPLRERKDDILPLLGYYLNDICKKYSVSKRFNLEATNFLLGYNWPGNVRELINLSESLVVNSIEDVITLKDVSSAIDQKDRPPARIIVTDIMNIKSAVDELEHKLVNLAMDKYGSTTKAAAVLGINQSTVVRKLKKLNTQD